MPIPRGGPVSASLLPGAVPPAERAIIEPKPVSLDPRLMLREFEQRLTHTSFAQMFGVTRRSDRRRVPPEGCAIDPRQARDAAMMGAADFVSVGRRSGVGPRSNIRNPD